MAKLGLARLHVEQGAVTEGAKEIGEIWKADASFLRVERPTVQRRTVSARNAPSCSAFWKNGKQRAMFPQEIVALFRTRHR